MNTIAPMKRSPLKFFVLVFVLALPFWLVGALTMTALLPSVPLAALGVVCPITAALILVYRENKVTGVKELLKRAFDFKRVKRKIWYVPVILLMPCIGGVTYIVMHLMGQPIPIPQFSIETTLSLFLLFFIAAVCEELGWAGYATDPLQKRFGALGGALLLGFVWSLWHYVPLLEVPQSFAYIAWWTLSSVAARVIITWLYNNTGKSVFVAALFHTMMNVTWQLFPVSGSYYDMRVVGPITAIVAIVVVFVWGSQTLVSRR